MQSKVIFLVIIYNTISVIANEFSFIMIEYQTIKLIYNKLGELKNHK